MKKIWRPTVAAKGSMWSRFSGGGSRPVRVLAVTAPCRRRSAVRCSRSVVLGGIASEVTGGKLRNGAATAAFTWALSQGANRIANSKAGVHYDSEGNAEFYLADAHEKIGRASCRESG